MAITVLLIILGLSIGLAFLSRRGAISNSMSDVLVASRSFGAILLFFVAVGETYSIGTMIGVPGAVYSKGASWLIWAVGYLMLGFCLGYFISPMIWRMGRLSGAVTIAEAFKWRFNSKAMEILVASIVIIFLFPWILIQFAGLGIIVKHLGIDVSHTVAVVVSAVIAFFYVSVAGIRAPAWVSVMKDILMVGAMVAAGIVAAYLHPGGVEGIFRDVVAAKPEHITIVTDPVTLHVTPAISTIIFQCMGICMFPLTFQFIFTGKSEDIVRRNQMFMPLYMYMYPFLIIAAYYVVATVPHLDRPDESFMVLVATHMPPWLVGMVAGGGALTCILVAALCALNIAGLFTQSILRHVIPSLSQRTSVSLTNSVTAGSLALGAVLALTYPSLMFAINRFAYYGYTQFFPVVVAAAFWKRTTTQGAFCCLFAGFIAIFVQVYFETNLFGWNINIGLWSLILNSLVIYFVSLATQPDAITAANGEKMESYDPLEDTEHRATAH